MGIMSFKVLVISVLAISGSLSSANEVEQKIKEVLDKNIGEAFLVNVNGCSGTFITKDWVLTAAHCYKWVKNYANAEPNVAGDHVYIVQEYERELVRKTKASGLSSNDSWTDEIRISEENGTAYVRHVKRFITAGAFLSEALSWKGGDLALLELKPESETQEAPKGLITPACLGDTDFPDLNAPNTYMVGFGRRNVPYCLTDQKGPEKYGLCRRPYNCYATAFSCGVKFEYENEEYSQCSRNATPSAENPVCKELWEQEPSLRLTTKPVHIFTNDKHVTSCFAASPPDGTKGWCATTPPGPQSDADVTFTSGWGFCSSDHSQRFCESNIYSDDGSYNTTEQEVDILDEGFCKEKLGANLAVEQPDVTSDEYQNLAEEKGIICIGRNNSRPTSSQKFFKKDSSFVEIEDPSQYLLDQLEEKGLYSPNEINGGPSCFGDSGGPLFSLIYDPQIEKVVPVLTGVFSYVLWGQCQGRADPVYYVRMKNSLDWLRAYVPEEDVCWYGSTNGVSVP